MENCLVPLYENRISIKEDDMKEWNNIDRYLSFKNTRDFLLSRSCALVPWSPLFPSSMGYKERLIRCFQDNSYDGIIDLIEMIQGGEDYKLLSEEFSILEYIATDIAGKNIK